ncbi:efflux RND transporter permease subunit [Dasania sp. GY-MA-18]|uniref:Efflux RND transporter permease subunit n=1 Tax=Dasania phycosphaerae TaxID=2950436 RepID=A0A9J6RMJ7_9GAMM|nr:MULTISPECIES: efflux RND transporter permease subunit [Dasania]MCR8923260.1 efflux RND transporter permease subunit [Dasania sp. GY-MA-18]MCZ0865692.1 efflux RND transporter permease subunit [Dasania phycosphaerae]MCZ0869417.1 efflux RND transporter permease subunit [Dasania phycosphaerae]
MIQERGVIAWMARNSVAANLLMWVVIMAGVNALFTITKEVFPSFPSEVLTITVPYPGSSPEEVEEGILIKIEEQIQDLIGIDEIISRASEGSGVVTVKVKPGTDIATFMNKVKLRVDGISSFPLNAEPAIIEEQLSRTRAINLTLYGELSEHDLKRLADKMRDDLLAIKGITEVVMVGTRDYEISIEISDIALQQYGLSFDQVVNAIQNQSKDLPGGKLRTEGGTITLRSIGQAYTADEFSELSIINQADGTRISLGDIAVVKDAFADQPVLSELNQVHGITLQVERVGEQDVLAISEQVKQYVAQQTPLLPEGVGVSHWQDRTEILKSRINLMLKSAFQGMVLVAISLALLLELSLAFWVVVGLPFCVLGTIFIMDLAFVNLSINIVSLFGFILVLGILVDDAIVTAESAYTQLEEENDGVNSIIRGVRRVAVPTTFGVLTTIFAFMPLVLATEGIARFFSVMAPVIIIALLFSLLETKLILPSHLRHIKIRRAHEAGVDKGMGAVFRRMQSYCSGKMASFAQQRYMPALDWALRYRYITLSIFVAVLILALGLVQSGIVRQVFFPSVPSDGMSVDMTMPQGSSYTLTHDYARRIERAAMALNEHYHEVSGSGVDVVKQIYTLSESDTQAKIRVELINSTERSITSVEIAKWWREKIGELPGVKSFTIDANAGHAGIPIDVELQSDNLEQLRLASEDIRKQLLLFDGVFDVRDTFDAGGPEIDVQLTREGEALGLGQAELARQVRQAFFGAEVQRIQRGRHEVRVYVRFPEHERNSLSTLQHMWVQLPDGGKVPFAVVGRAVERKGVSTINRIDRRRVVNVQADVDKVKVSPSDVILSLQSEILPEVLQRYPDVNYRFTGEEEARAENIASLSTGVLVMLMIIYAALAIPLRSYGLPLIIMAVIPFGVVGAILGHLLLGQDISIISIVGIIALSGIAVNDSLVLVDYINHRYHSGLSWRAAIKESGPRRFRAVVLTSVTTFAGLLPIQLERSIQAQFLKPMAVSVAFGVIFATVVTLILVPVLCYIAGDFKQWIKRRRGQFVQPLTE